MTILSEVFGSASTTDPIPLKYDGKRFSTSIFSSRNQCLYSCRLAQSLKEIADIEWTEPKYIDFIKTHPALLYPVVKSQKIIRRKTLGLSRWHNLEIYREKQGVGRAQFLRLIQEMKPRRSEIVPSSKTSTRL